MFKESNVWITNNRMKMNIFVLMIILFSQDSIIYASGEIVEYQQESFLILLRYVAFISCAFFCIVNAHYKKGGLVFKSTDLLWVILLLSTILFSMIVNRDFDGFYIVISIILSSLIVAAFGMEEYYAAFRRVMKYVSALSIVVYLLFKVLGPVMVSFRDGINTSNFIGAIIQRFLMKCYAPWIECNSAIFRERGVFAFYIAIAFIILLREDTRITKKNIIEVCIYLIALFSTGGSSAFISIGVLLVGYFITSAKRTNPKIIIITIFGGLLGITFIVSAFVTIISKFDSSSYLGDSGITRWMSIKVAAIAIAKSFGLGMGAENFDLMYQSIIKTTVGMTSTAFTNSILGIGAYFGIVPLIIVILGMIRFSKCIKINSIHWIFVFIVLLLNLFLQNESCMTLFWCMVLYGIFSREEKNERVNIYSDGLRCDNISN